TKGGGATVSSGTTAGGGATVNSGTTAGGGAYVQGSSTQSGGGTTVGSTSQSGGGATSSSGGNHRHQMFRFDGFINHQWKDTVTATVLQPHDNKLAIYVESAGWGGDLYTKGESGTHSHTVPAHTHNFSVSIPSHSHNFSINIPNHSHSFSFTLKDHTHSFSFTLKDHTHEIELPDHTHEIEYGIFEDSNNANQVTIKVDDTTVSGKETRRERFNLVDYLSKQTDGTISRGWHEIVMTPNKLARIEAQITMRVFIKSQLGGEF
ncbi:MAG: hypothetical protein ACLTXM_09240, partial [Enterococcus sp.]